MIKDLTGKYYTALRYFAIFPCYGAILLGRYCLPEQFNIYEWDRIYQMKKSFSFSILAVSLLVGNAYGEYNLSTNFNPQATQGATKSKLTGDFGIRTNDLVEDVGDVVGNKHFGDLNLNYSSYSGSSKRSFELSTRVNDEQQMMYSIKEASIEFNRPDSRFVLGRTILDWSQADRIWGLGKLNNRVNFDYFEPGQEGLTGLLFEKKYRSGFSYSAFGSILYIPEMNPSLEIDPDKKTIICKNPWCDAPAASTDFEGKQVPIYYNVNYPEIADVVFRYSAGLKLGYESGIFGINGFFMRKPENNISVAAEISAEPDLSAINVDATPQVYYHNILGGNIELQVSSQLKLYGSAISIDPNNVPDGSQPLIEYTGLKPNKKKEEYLGGGALYANGDFTGHIGYIARVSEFDKENDLLVDLPRWNQAIHLALNKNITNELFIGLDYKFDMLTEDRLTMLQTSYRFGPSILASLGVNIIGTDPEQESFWSKFENNDSVYSSLKYSF